MVTVAKAGRLIAAGERATYSVGAGNFDTILKIATGDLEQSVSIVEHVIRPHTLAAPLHRHSNEDEITYVISGELTLLQNGEITLAKAGEYVTKPRHVWHTFWNATEEPVHMMELIVPGGFEQYFAELTAIIPADGPPDMGALIALGARYGLEYDLASIPELMETHHLGM